MRRLCRKEVRTRDEGELDERNFEIFDELVRLRELRKRSTDDDLRFLKFQNTHYSKLYFWAKKKNLNIS